MRRGVCPASHSGASAEPIELTTIALRRAARAAITLEVRAEFLTLRRRWTVVDEAVDSDGRADPLDDELAHLQHSLTVV